MELLITFFQTYLEYFVGALFTLLLVILFWKDDEDFDNKTWIPFD